MRVIMEFFISDNKIDTRLLCKESKEYLKSEVGEQSTFSKVLDFTSLSDNELGLKKQSIIEKLKQIEEENADKIKEHAKMAKNRFAKSLLGLSILSVAALVLASVILFVPAITTMTTAAIATLLVAGPFALPLLITAGIVMSALAITPSLIFVWKKYKNIRAYDKSMYVVKQLSSKLESVLPISPKNNSNFKPEFPDEILDNSSNNSRRNSLKSIVSNSSSFDSDTPESNRTINYDSLVDKLKQALEWRKATLEKNPSADASYDAYIYYCNSFDQTDSENKDQIDSTQFEKLYNKFQNSNIDKIDAFSVEVALKSINQEIKPDRHSASSFYKLADKLSPQELQTADQDFDALYKAVC